jgi:hypothetical protein
MATKSPRQHHNYWGTFAVVASLPNVSGAPTQDGALEVGDLAYVTGLGTYQCDSATLGSAVWSSVAAGSVSNVTEYDWATGYIYDQQVVPIEETMGFGRLNGAQIQGTAYFRATWDPQFGAAGNAYVRLYDVGPAAGPPAAPVLIATLTTASSGLRYSEQALAVGGAPGANQIANSARMYEVTVDQSSQAGDTVVVGSAGVSDR